MIDVVFRHMERQECIYAGSNWSNLVRIVQVIEMTIMVRIIDLDLLPRVNDNTNNILKNCD